MWLDAQNLFSDGQSMAIANGANALSTNVIDLGVASTPPLGGSLVDDPGRGKSKHVLCQVTTAPGGAGSTLQVQLLMADSADMATNPVILLQTDNIPVATLVAGYQFRLGDLPAGITKRYLALKYLNGSANAMTGGALSAGLVPDVQTNNFVG